MTRKYDLYSQAFHQQSHQVFQRMRRDDPVFQQMGITGEFSIWFVTRYPEVEYVLLHDELFVRDPGLALSPEELEPFLGAGDARIDALVNNHMLNKEGRDHTRLRGLVSKAFTPRVIQAMRPRIQVIADELLNEVAPHGRMDLVSEYAYPLPITVIAEMLGIPRVDRPRFRAWSNAVVKPALTAAEQAESLQLLSELVAYMQNLVAERRRQPGEDLLSGLIQAEEEGDRLNESELFSMLSLLIVAGHETTVSFIGNATLALLKNRTELERLLAGPGITPAVVEELLRYDSPVERALTRFVARDVELGGRQLRRGELIIVVLASANRDEGRFADPEMLDFTRPALPHMAFGKGVHYCLGAPLARLEGEIALNALFHRFPDLQLVHPSEEVAWREVPLFHSLERLEVCWGSSAGLGQH